MADKIFLPQWGMGMQEATIIKWLKSEGDEVKKGDPVVEVESSKVNAEVEATADGILLKIREGEGAVVKVGGILAFIGEEGEVIEDDGGLKTESIQDQDIKINKAKQNIKVQVTPIARKLAKELGVDLEKVVGTGPNGRITEDDIKNYSPGENEKSSDDQISGIRKIISLRMTESNQIPSVTLTSKIDVSECVKFQSDLLKEWRKEKIRPTFQDIVAKAVVKSLIDFNIFNSHFVDNQIKRFNEINLGIAYALEEGLVVPVIKNSQEKSLLEVAKEIREFSSKEKKGFTQEDVSGSTFSITSLNSTVVDSFNPLINPPEVGILGIGRISDETQLVSDKPTIRKICFFNLTFDHRVVDGFPAAKFLESITNNIQNPKSLVEN
ncbi:MAG: hypothetical protein CL769_04670 [Chloroflexi bacterium]|nr:hypothetical protein [Chloroflexota bacterium]|tara:strand:- start:1954 stop:3096 length:1143 start_codon:yes stop_codon:yes gene_type:complete